MAQSQEITTAARRIAKVLNRKRGQGGFCVFNRNGSGGYWYSDRSFPSLSADEVSVSVPDGKITQTEAQEKLDALGAANIDDRQCADCGYPVGDKPVFLGGVWFCATCKTTWVTVTVRQTQSTNHWSQRGRFSN